MFLFVFRCIYTVKSHRVNLDFPHLRHILLFHKNLHHRRKPAGNQIFLEQIQHLSMQGFRQGLTRNETLPHGFQGQLPYAIGNQKLFKIHRIHPFDFDTAHRQRRCLPQSDTQQGSACYISKPAILLQKLQQGQQVVVGLNLIDKYQSIAFFLHFAASHHAQRQIEITYRPGFGKNPVPQTVFLHVQLYVILIELPSHLPNDETFPYLTRPFNNQNSFAISFKMIFNILTYLSIQIHTLFLFLTPHKYTLFLQNNEHKNTLFL